MTERPIRVAMTGTFDVANFGDLLFPLIAQNELERRLGGIEVVPYSYHAVAPPEWPFSVRSLSALPGDLAHTDLLLVGGGDIIRGDEAVAPGYRPADPGVHHPLGTWLVPTLLAAAAGVPVAWNAVGVRANLPAWSAPLVATATACVAHLAVRQEQCAAALLELAPDAAPRVVPDTAFGVGAVLGDGGGGRAVREAAGLDGRPYVVVQPTRLLYPVRDAVLAAVEAARHRGLEVLEMSMGPVHGDVPGALDLPGSVGQVRAWPHPLAVAEVLAGAEAVIAESLHAGVVATSQGIPTMRPVALPGSKHTLLDGLVGIHRLDAPVFGRAEADPRLGDMLAQLAAHWDAVAEQARAPRVPAAAAMRLIGDLPRQLQEADGRAAAVAAERERAAEMAAAYDAYRVRSAAMSSSARAARAESDAMRVERDAVRSELDNVRAELDVARLELDRADAELAAIQPELDRLRKRDATLERVLSGGWWRLRDRIAPVLRLARGVRRLHARRR